MFQIILFYYPSEEGGVLGAENIPIAILLSCQNVRNVALLLHEHAHSWVVKKKHLRGSVQTTILTIILIELQLRK